MTDTEAMRALFDAVAGGYDQQVPFFAAFGREFVEWCGLRPGLRVLDLAAGRGAIAGPAARAVGPDGAVLAVDNAPAMLRALAADHPGLPRLSSALMDVHRLAVSDASVDVVTCGFALHFVDDAVRVIAEVWRVLRPGGRFAFAGPPTDRSPDAVRADPRWDFYADLMREMAERRGPDRPDPFTPPPRPLPELCRAGGFVDLDQRLVHKSFPVRDPGHYWDWQMSHGFRGFVESLGADLAAEFRRRLLAGLERLHENGGITVAATVAFDRMRKPGAPRRIAATVG